MTPQESHVTRLCPMFQWTQVSGHSFAGRSTFDIAIDVIEMERLSDEQIEKRLYERAMEAAKQYVSDIHFKHTGVRVGVYLRVGKN